MVGQSSNFERSSNFHIQFDLEYVRIVRMRSVQDMSLTNGAGVAANGCACLGLILSLLFHFEAKAQSPHGDEFKMDCARCHVPDNWTTMADPMVFDHDSTGFSLIGQHVILDCGSCHGSVRFDEAVPSDCFSCHIDVHAMSVGNDCVRCHTPNTWLVDDIPELHEQNGFSLVGVHSNLSCVDCHTADNTLAFARVGNDCINCHQSDFMATRVPNHVEAGFSSNCIECHDPMGSGWATSFASHDFFPLTHGHDNLECTYCHTTGTFSDASPVCSSCHMEDFTSTVSPNHSTAGFSTDCASCHNTGPGWTASFDHNSTAFPLHGAHMTTACLECHASVFVGTPTACNGCHMADYNATSSTNHVAAQFPTDCAACHNEDSWTPATFNFHPYFPIYSGRHDDVWNNCATCHTNPNDYGVFTCTDCHNDQNDLADEHDEVSGYSYNSNACYSCHPDGNE
jgi:hypothetical protein